MKICEYMADFLCLTLTLPIITCQVDFTNLIYDKYGFKDGVTPQLSSKNLTELINKVLDGRYHNTDRLEAGDKDWPEKMCQSPLLNHTSFLLISEFDSYCPKILYSLTQDCVKSKEEIRHHHHHTGATIEEKPSASSVWQYGLAFVTLINLLSLLGIFVIPVMNKSFYSTLLMFLISLAVGTLAASSIINLIPEAFHVQEQEGYRWRACTILGGIYLFFVIERVLKIITDISITKANVDNNCNGNGEVGIFSSPAQSLPEKKKKPVATVAWMIILGDTFHNFTDGLLIGAAFSNSILLGISVCFTVICEELPHELGDFVILTNSGISKKRALLFNILSACFCYLGLVIGITLSQVSHATPWLLGIAGGMFLYIALVDKIPEMNHAAEEHKDKPMRVFLIQNAGLLTGFAAIILITTFRSDILLGMFRCLSHFFRV